MNAILHLSILSQKLLHSPLINKPRLNVDHLTDSSECCVRQMEYHHWLDAGFQTVTSVKKNYWFPALPCWEEDQKHHFYHYHESSHP